MATRPVSLWATELAPGRKIDRLEAQNDKQRCREVNRQRVSKYKSI